MVRFRWLNAFVVAAVVSSCGKELPELDGIDKKAFIEDRNGCLQKRRSMVDAIQNQKEKLLALEQMQIVALLGKPDHNELYKRNQKFFYYYLHPGPDCALPTDTVSLKLVIRFNAMGLAKEVSVE
jgi:hypothetical protein